MRLRSISNIHGLHLDPTELCETEVDVDSTLNHLGHIGNEQGDSDLPF
jgi:hypothetical protein